MLRLRTNKDWDRTDNTQYPVNSDEVTQRRPTLTRVHDGLLTRYKEKDTENGSYSSGALRCVCLVRCLHLRLVERVGPSRYESDTLGLFQ